MTTVPAPTVERETRPIPHSVTSGNITVSHLHGAPTPVFIAKTGGDHAQILDLSEQDGMDLLLLLAEAMDLHIEVQP